MLRKEGCCLQPRPPRGSPQEKESRCPGRSAACPSLCFEGASPVCRPAGQEEQERLDTHHEPTEGRRGEIAWLLFRPGCMLPTHDMAAFTLQAFCGPKLLSKTSRRPSFKGGSNPDALETQPVNAGSIPKIAAPHCLAEVLCKLEMAPELAFPHHLQHKEPFRNLVSRHAAGTLGMPSCGMSGSACTSRSFLNFLV